MKGRSPLMLMELAVMLLVFMLAAALCLQAFAWADSQSLAGSRQDRALLQLQNAAEVLKAKNGDFSAAAQVMGGRWDGSQWVLAYDEKWEPAADGGIYTLRAEPEDSGVLLLGAARLQLLDGQGKILAQLRLCWQEVAP